MLEPLRMATLAYFDKQLGRKLVLQESLSEAIIETIPGETGKEPYSAALLLDRIAGPQPFLVIGADHDARVLAAAQDGGPYQSRDLRALDPQLLDAYFEPRAAGYFAGSRLRTLVEFRNLDLVADPIDGTYDLILYRDLETCFDSATNAEIYRKLVQALVPGGLLFVGALDSLPAALLSGMQKIHASIYRRLGPV